MYRGSQLLGDKTEKQMANKYELFSKFFLYIFKVSSLMIMIFFLVLQTILLKTFEIIL